MTFMRLGEMTDEQLEDEAKEHDRNGQTEARAVKDFLRYNNITVHQLSARSPR
jgi:hypothetical protein